MKSEDLTLDILKARKLAFKDAEKDYLANPASKEKLNNFLYKYDLYAENTKMGSNGYDATLVRRVDFILAEKITNVKILKKLSDMLKYVDGICGAGLQNINKDTLEFVELSFNMEFPIKGKDEVNTENLNCLKILTKYINSEKSKDEYVAFKEVVAAQKELAKKRHDQLLETSPRSSETSLNRSSLFRSRARITPRKDLSESQPVLPSITPDTSDDEKSTEQLHAASLPVLKVEAPTTSNPKKDGGLSRSHAARLVKTPRATDLSNISRTQLLTSTPLLALPEKEEVSKSPRSVLEERGGLRRRVASAELHVNVKLGSLLEFIKNFDLDEVSGRKLSRKVASAQLLVPVEDEKGDSSIDFLNELAQQMREKREQAKNNNEKSESSSDVEKFTFANLFANKIPELRRKKASRDLSRDNSSDDEPNTARSADSDESHQISSDGNDWQKRQASRENYIGSSISKY
jgi:hypothetical protein